MDDRYRTRLASSADAPAVAELERIVFSDPWSEPTVRAALVEGGLVAEADGQLVGYACFRRAADEAEILNLAVAPAHRRQGVARGLVDAALQRLHGEGARRVFLEVRESNESAREFYRRLGFQPVGRRSRYYRNPPEAALVLVRDLGSLGGTA